MFEQCASREVYDAMCKFVGTSKDIALRRDVLDINEILTGHGFDKNKKYRYFQNLSGSTREGFYLKESDIDVMIWLDCIKVIWRFSQSEHYNLFDDDILCFDSSKSPPGYILPSIVVVSSSKYFSLSSGLDNISNKPYPGGLFRIV